MSLGASSSRIPRYPATRVTSPGVGAAAFAVANSAGEGQERASALSFVNSVSEVIGLIESEYRELLRPSLNKLADTARRSLAVDSSLKKLEDHHVRGTFPPFLEGNRKPALQLGAEFALAQKAELEKFDAEHVSFKRCALKQALDLKRSESEYVHSQLAPEKFVPGLLDTIRARFAELNARVKEPVWETVGEEPTNGPDGDGDIHMEDGEIRLTGWTHSPRLKADMIRLQKDIPAIGLRIIMCAQASGDKQAASQAAKKSLKARADVEMGDAANAVAGPSTPNKSIQALVDKAVAAALKKAGSSPASGKKPHPPSQQKGKGKAKPTPAKAQTQAKEAGKKTKRGKRAGKGGKSGKKTQ